MLIKYNKNPFLKKVDIDQLRPKNSYAKLIQNRTHPIQDMIRGETGKIDDEKLTDRVCPNCGSESKETLFVKDCFPIDQCRQCELVYVGKLLKESHYKEIYASQDFQKIMEDLGGESHMYRVERFGRERIEKLKEYAGSSREIRYLDVGCSTGFVVEAAQNEGWLAKGIELNPTAVAFGSERGLDIENMDLVTHCQETKNKYDVISMYDVLEHLYSPSDIIEHAKWLLRHSGLLHIYVPNYNSVSRLLMGNDAHYIWPTHHLTYFTPETLAEFLSRRGFEILDIETDGIDIEDYRWHIKNKSPDLDVNALDMVKDVFQTMSNAALWGKNLRMVCRLT